MKRQSDPGTNEILEVTGGSSGPGTLVDQGAAGSDPWLVTVTNAGSGGTASAFGDPQPLLGTAAGATDPDGNMAPLNVDADGKLIVAASVSVDPAGLAISTTTGDAVPALVNPIGLENNSGDAVTAKADAAGNLLVSDTTSQTTLSAINTKLTNPLPVSGTVTANQGTAGASPWLITTTGLPVTSATFATAAKQDTGNASLASIDGKLTSGIVITGTVTVSGTVSNNPLVAFNSGNVSSTTQRVVLANDVALPAGTNILGKVGIDQTTPGTTNAVQATNFPSTVDVNSGVKSNSTLRIVIATDQPQLTNALKVDGSAVTQPVSIAGTVTISGTVTANAGTNLNTSLLALESGGNLATLAGIVSSSRAAVNLIPGSAGVAGGSGVISTTTQRVTLATDDTLGGTIFTDDSAFTPGTSKVQAHGLTADETSTDSVDEGDIGIPRMTLDRKTIVTPYAHGAGGYLPATGSIGATKTDIGTANTPGVVAGWYFYNPNASVAYVQFFNAQASAVTLGTTAPVYSLGIPASSAANLPAVGPGIGHTTAISIAITTTRAGSSGPGSTVDYNIWYKQ